ncbi:unnamed protein product [Oikopleura dioica]|uniref:MSL3 chromodomain-like domain-containing protein n=1 Tax=Oikopleura dioica TaxID=34765 RepID=E4WXI6_OIKDI|nr:unnamed protein product [Oikopleura dioica]
MAYSVGEKVFVKYSEGVWYGAKVLDPWNVVDREENTYLVHYIGWNKSHDEVVHSDLIRKTKPDKNENETIDRKPLKRTRKKRTKRARPTKEQMAEEIKKVKQEMEEDIAPLPPPDNADPIQIDLDPTISNRFPNITIPLVSLDPSVTYHAPNTYMTSPRKPVSELRLMSVGEDHIKFEEVKEEPTSPTENRPSTSFFDDSSLMLCETPASKNRRSHPAIVPVVPRATQSQFLTKVKRESGARELDYARCWAEPWLNFQREVETFGFSQAVAAKVLEQNVEECERALLRITEKNRRNLPENIKTKAKLKLFKETFSEDEEDAIDINEFFADSDAF